MILMPLVSMAGPEVVAKGDLAILFQHGAVPHRRNLVTRGSPLHMAAKYGNTEMLQLLLGYMNIVSVRCV